MTDPILFDELRCLARAFRDQADAMPVTLNDSYAAGRINGYKTAAAIVEKKHGAYGQLVALASDLPTPDPWHKGRRRSLRLAAEEVRFLIDRANGKHAARGKNGL